MITSWLLIIFLGGLGASCSKQSNPATIEYQGEHFRLSRPFEDYDEYKEATNNIATDELERIEKKIMSTPIAKEFGSKTDFVAAALMLKFPGHGFGGLDSADKVYTATITIPGKDPMKADARYITAVEENGRWRVVDDFKGPTPFGGSTVELKTGELIYKSYDGVEFRRKQIK